MTDKMGNVLGSLDRQKSWLPLLIRVATGVVFALAGYDKIFVWGISNTVSSFAQFKVPLGQSVGYLVPIIEFAGGICIILGLGTRIWSFLNAWVMVFAIAFVHLGEGFKMGAILKDFGGGPTPVPTGWAFQAMILACCITLLIGGPGTLSVDHLIRRRKAPPTSAASA